MSIYKELAKTIKKQYKEAIRIWTEYDPLKMKTARDNNLNYLTIYN